MEDWFAMVIQYPLGQTSLSRCASLGLVSVSVLEAFWEYFLLTRWALDSHTVRECISFGEHTNNRCSQHSMVNCDEGSSTWNERIVGYSIESTYQFTISKKPKTTIWKRHPLSHTPSCWIPRECIRLCQVVSYTLYGLTLQWSKFMWTPAWSLL